MMRTRGREWIALALAILGTLAIGGAEAGTIRDLVDIHGAPPIALHGTGIVTGLANTGDSKAAAQDLLRQYMRNINFDFDQASLATGNIALVQVTAEVPPFLRPGQRFPVSVTSTNGAKSLAGGELLSCDLYNGEREVMAKVTGQVKVSGAILTRGRIHDGQNSGATLMVPYPFGRVMNEKGWIRLNLKRANWADAAGIARQINQSPALNPYLQEATMFAEAEAPRPVAFAKDAGQVVVVIPGQFRTTAARYISNIMEVPVSVDRPAMIVVNRGRNSIVVTGDVQVNNATISIQDKTVTIRPETPEEPAAYTLDDATPRSVVEIDGPGTYADLQGLIDTMNAMGMNTEQVITVFEELQAAGALRAEIVNQ
ncbi:MAG: flagellar basal body P-ring protein FlgI [Planctomycetota bacterium]|jgi:flagellar P-ring protein precursor FlgI|nr:flagellar basal body P-ring protein FlgI [Planctomycetota bacterium]